MTEDRSNCGCKPSCCTEQSKGEVYDFVKQTYGQIARGEKSSCGCSSSCCVTEKMSSNLGYSSEEISSPAAQGNLGIGCGYPLGFAELKPGDVVLDLGSGAGFDALLAAQQVGDSGYVYGIDMTPEMVERAESNRRKAGVSNVEFHLAEIESLPLADNQVDVIISNCVVNLSPEKKQVFNEAYRVLKPGGRLAISDIVALGPLSAATRTDLEQIAACVGGASTFDELEKIINEAGFTRVSLSTSQSPLGADSGFHDYITSAAITAIKP